MADFRNWESHLWKREAFSRDFCVYTIGFFIHIDIFFFEHLLCSPVLGTGVE